MRAARWSWALLPLAGALLPARAQEEEERSPAAVAARAFPALLKVYGAGGFAGVPAYGSGVVVDERGFALTAWSIALRTDELKVVTHDGSRHPAVVWRADPGLGVALLRVVLPPGARPLPALRLGDSTRLAAGDPVIALGNPFGMIYGDERPTVMTGVVSWVGPARVEGVRVSRLPEGLPELILTDVPNNPGTQGGALLGGQGELVGILGRLVESRATNTILNYAVPTHLLREFVREAVAWEAARPEPPRPAAPASPVPVESGIRLQRAHLVRSPLAYVELVVRGSAAERAGIRPDDLVFRLGGRTIRSCRDFDEALEARRPGETVTVVLKRGERMLPVELTLEEVKR
jgi:serine protease Do